MRWIYRAFMRSCSSSGSQTSEITISSRTGTDSTEVALLGISVEEIFSGAQRKRLAVLPA